MRQPEGSVSHQFLPIDRLDYSNISPREEMVLREPSGHFAEQHGRQVIHHDRSRIEIRPYVYRMCAVHCVLRKNVAPRFVITPSVLSLVIGEDGFFVEVELGFGVLVFVDKPERVTEFVQNDAFDLCCGIGVCETLQV